MDSLQHRLFLALPGLRNIGATVKGLLVNRERYGEHYFETVRRLESRDGWTAARMREHQAERLQEIVGIAAGHVPYYRALFSKLGLSARDIHSPDDLRKLPILEKDLVRADPLQFVDERIALHSLVPETTTGSTGTPIRVLMTPQALQEHYAFFEVRCRRMTGWRYGREPFVSFGVRRVVALERTTPPFWCYNYAGKQLYMSVYHLAPQFLRYYCTELKRRPYRALVGYPSAVATLAQYVLEKGGEGASIPVAITSGETLHPQQKDVITRAFACQVYDQYGCAEMSVFGAEGRCGSMHLSPDYGVTEVVDDSGNPVPPGTSGHLVCTSLINTAQILLRYRMGDAGALAGGECACGSILPVLQSVDGRTANAILLPDGRKLFRMSAIDAEIPTIREYQIVQEEIGVFTMFVVPADGFQKSDAERAALNLRANVGTARIDVRPVSSIPRGPGGKFSSVVSKVTADGIHGAACAVTMT